MDRQYDLVAERHLLLIGLKRGTAGQPLATSGRHGAAY
jgi:hypothetical protein